MAAPIEQLLRSAKTLNALDLVLEASKSVTVRTSSGSRELTKTQLSPYDIFKLLSPIMPEDKKVALVGQPSTEFSYEMANVGHFHVNVIKEDNGIKVIIKNLSYNADNLTGVLTSPPELPATNAITSSHVAVKTGAYGVSSESTTPLNHQAYRASSQPAPPIASDLPETTSIPALPMPTAPPVRPMAIRAQPVPQGELSEPPPMAQPGNTATSSPFKQPGSPGQVTTPPIAQAQTDLPATSMLAATTALPVEEAAGLRPRSMPAPNTLPNTAPIALSNPVPMQPASSAPPSPSSSPFAQPPNGPALKPPPMAQSPNSGAVAPQQPLSQGNMAQSSYPAQPAEMAQQRPPVAQAIPYAQPIATAMPVAQQAVPQVQDEATSLLNAQQRAATPMARPVPPPAAKPMTPPMSQSMQIPTSTASPASTMSRTMGGMTQTGERQRLKTEIDKLLERTVKMKGSDLHLASGAPPIVRRFGSLIRLEGDAMDGEKAQLLLRELLTDEQNKRFESNNDLDFSYEIIGVGRFRGNALRQQRGVDLTFHIIPADIQSPEELGLPALVRGLTRNHQGLIMVTGASGQGKSTTISALIDVINDERPLHIITVEDPIEFVHPINKKAIVNQREVGRHTHSFANALRAALREDPDVIVVGELRDQETIALAITAAETGHLVMGTMMTPSAHLTVDRIIESFPATQQNQIRTMLSESLRAVISQRLIPRTDENGMVLAAEILLGTPAVANLIRDKKTFQIPSIIQTNRPMGMKRMDDALLELAQQKKISVQKAIDFALDKKSMETALRQ